jgi:hypothetical protein
MDQGREIMWEIQSNPHLRIGPQWYTVATFKTKEEASAYLNDHRDRLARGEGTDTFRVWFEEDGS